MKDSLHNVNDVPKVVIMNKGIICCSTSQKEGFQIGCRSVVSFRALAEIGPVQH